jgi:hypothetical protein
MQRVQLGLFRATRCAHARCVARCPDPDQFRRRQRVAPGVGNLILTRLLFPEAFGLMALVQVFLSGLQMFSDIGIQTSVIRSKRGEDPAFLDTAWTVQVLRGGLLWLGCLGIAGPAAAFYEEANCSSFCRWWG